MGTETGKALLALATRDIGYHEGANKSNKFGAWYGMNNVAWCMQAVQYWYAQAGIPLPFKTASCGSLLRWYKENYPECVKKEPIPGCIVIFDFPKTAYTTDHTGLFVSKTADSITTIDGNTSGTNQSNGGWVQQKTRKLSYANPVYIVPSSLTSAKATKAKKTEKAEKVDKTEKAKNTKITEEDEMAKRYNTLDEIKGALPWAVESVEKMIQKNILRGREDGFDLSEDMLRMIVYNDRAGLYG